MASFIGADYRLCSHAMKDVLPEAIELLRQLVNMESPSYDKALADVCGRFVAERFEAIGGRIEIVPDGRFGDHVLARFGSSSETPLILLGHIDTVFPKGEIEKRPFTVNGSRATGPGVFDMKGGIVLMWMAMRQLGHRHNVTVLLTSDEEVGSNASRALIEYGQSFFSCTSNCP